MDATSNSSAISEKERNEIRSFAEMVQRGFARGVKQEIAELRRLKLPIIWSKDGKPYDFNPETNPDAPPWKEEE